MNAWELLKDLVKTKKELERVRSKYFGRENSDLAKIAPFSQDSLIESIRLIRHAIEDLTVNLTK